MRINSQSGYSYDIYAAKQASFCTALLHVHIPLWKIFSSLNVCFYLVDSRRCSMKQMLDKVATRENRTLNLPYHMIANPCESVLLAGGTYSKAHFKIFKNIDLL